MSVMCCVCGIEKGTSQDLNFTFHSFPRNKDLRLKWYEAIGKRVLRNARICSKHFKTEDYRNHKNPSLKLRLLTSSAVPNILCRELESTENDSSDTVDTSIGNNDENCELVNHNSLEFKNRIINERSDNELQIDESSSSIEVDNPATEKILDKAKSYIINETSKRKTKDYYLYKKLLCILQSKEEPRCKNSVCFSEVIKKEDFIYKHVWSRFRKYIYEMRKQYKFLLRKNRRLHLELSDYKDMLERTLRTK